MAMVTDAQPAASWNIAKQVFTLWEYDFDKLLKVLPEDIDPVEIRPGRCLIVLGATQYLPGNYGENSPAFNELVLMAIAVPDLSVDMPQPRYAFFGMEVLTDSQAFIDHKAKTILVPAKLDSSLSIEFEADNTGFTASTSEGQIFSTRFPVSGDFKEDRFYGQYFSIFDENLRHGCWSWQGIVHENMKRPEQTHFNLNHSFLAKLQNIKPNASYRQMLTERETPSITHFYTL